MSGIPRCLDGFGVEQSSLWVATVQVRKHVFDTGQGRLYKVLLCFSQKQNLSDSDSILSNRNGRRSVASNGGTCADLKNILVASLSWATVLSLSLSLKFLMSNLNLLCKLQCKLPIFHQEHQTVRKDPYSFYLTCLRPPLMTAITVSNIYTCSYIPCITPTCVAATSFPTLHTR